MLVGPDYCSILCSCSVNVYVRTATTYFILAMLASRFKGESMALPEFSLWCDLNCICSDKIFTHAKPSYFGQIGFMTKFMKAFHPIYSDFTANKKCARWSQDSLYGDLEHLQSTQLLLRYFSLDHKAFYFPSLNLTYWKVIILAKVSLNLTRRKWDKHYVTLAVIVHTVAVYFNDLILKIHGEMKWNSVNDWVYCTAVTINHLWLNCWPKLSLSDDQLCLRNDYEMTPPVRDVVTHKHLRCVEEFSGPVQII